MSPKFVSSKSQNVTFFRIRSLQTRLLRIARWDLAEFRVKAESEKVGLKLTFRKQRSWHLVPSLHGK